MNFSVGFGAVRLEASGMSAPFILGGYPGIDLQESMESLSLEVMAPISDHQQAQCSCEALLSLLTYIWPTIVLSLEIPVFIGKS